jgi:hypothetical protein
LWEGARTVFWSLFHGAEIRSEIARAIREHGDAAEAYLNYPLQDPDTPAPRRRLMKAALRGIRARGADMRSGSL